jgi:tRNA A-37 threonylcarbamoyl transferase component Bud32
VPEEKRTLQGDRYTIIRELGSGGMGRVYLSHDEKMESEVVIKEMLPFLATPKERDYIRKHFKEEAKMLYRLKHPGLPRVTDYFFEGDSIYIIMEYIKGKDLESIIKGRSDGKISLDEFFQWIIRVLDVLKYLHSQDPPIIHRDIKPGNIMLTDDGDVFLVDFGVAKAIAGKTVTQTRVGTPGFASPEHFFGKFILSSDIYSLGATFHYLLTGDDPRSRNPFDYPPLNLYRDDIPQDLQKLLDKMLETERENRYALVEDVRRDLVALSKRLAAKGILTSSVDTGDLSMAAPQAAGVPEGLESATAAPTVAGEWQSSEDILFEGAVCSVAFSPNNEFIACGTGSNDLSIISVETHEILKTLSGHTDWVRTVTFSPDGRYVASGSDDNNIKIWDHAAGKETKTLAGHEDWVRSIAYSPDGSYLVSGSYDKRVKIWSTRSWSAIVTIDQFDDSVNCVAFSPNGRTVASGCDDSRIYLWNARTGELLNQLEGHDSYVHSVAFSPDGRLLASGSGDTTIKIWDMSTGENVLNFVGHEGSILSLSFSPDGSRLVSGSEDMKIRMWVLKTGECENVLEGHSYHVYSVAFSPNGNQLISGSGDKTLAFWSGH